MQREFSLIQDSSFQRDQIWAKNNHFASFDRVKFKFPIHFIEIVLSCKFGICILKNPSEVYKGDC